MKNVMDMEGPSRTGAWIILKGEKHVGKIIAAYPSKGHGERRTYVQVFDWARPNELPGKNVIYAGGYGYCKVDACMEKLGFGGLKLPASGWESCLEKNGYTVLEVI